MAIAYGLRNCRECRGICHEGSWRRTTGKRRAYWCSEEHLRSYEETRIAIGVRSQFPSLRDKEIEVFKDAAWARHRDLFYERVDVRTA